MSAAIKELGLQQSFDSTAHLRIRERAAVGLPATAIARELNAAGLRHRRGVWTADRVRDALRRINRDEVPGVPPVPSMTRLAEQVRTLHDQGLPVAEIAHALNVEDAKTRLGTPVTRGNVAAILYRLGLQSQNTHNYRRVVARLVEWAPAMTQGEMADRLNELGLRTRQDRCWTRKSVAAALGRQNLTTVSSEGQ